MDAYIDRYNYQLCDRTKIREPPRELIQMLLQRILAEGLICHYCGRDLDIYATPGNYKMTLSLDHKIPFSKKLDNSVDNLVICCYRCNIAKGTKSYEAFKTAVDKLKWANRTAMEKFLDDLFKLKRKTAN